MDELLQRAAEKMGMPPTLAERSAQARAEKEGTTVEAVLREWAGEDAPAAANEAGSESTDASPAEAQAPTAAPDAPPSAAGPAEVTTDYLVDLAAQAKRMPPKLVRSSAEARARNSKGDLDEVLAQWAGVDLDDLKAQAAAGTAPAIEEPVEETPAPAASAPSEPAPAEEAPAAPAAAAVAATMSMDELLDKVAEAKGMPAALAKRSAEARAKKTGEPLEAVLAEWAGVDPATVAGAGSAPAPAQEAAPAPAQEAPPAEEPKADVEVIEAEAPAPSDGDVAEPVTAGGKYPGWLAAAFVLIPILAVVYILVAPNGPDCGVAGQLKVDPATGLAVNCDGSEYGSSEIDYFSIGAGIYSQCAACHGSDGGGGVGPAFTGGAVLTTFPAGSCSDHVEWVALGTANFPEPTYGATDKPVGGVGVMPGYEATLTPEEIATVSLYERVAFGGQPLEEAQLDCGLVVPEGEEGAETTDEMTEASAEG